MIVELMRAGGPDLVRRWVAALLSVPEAERETIVESVEGRIAEVYHAPDGAGEAEAGEAAADGGAEVAVRLKARRRASAAD
jgi:hypothetical protein